MVNAVIRQDLRDDPDDGEEHGVRHRVLDRHGDDDGQEQQPDQAQGPRRVLAEAGVVAPAGERQDGRRTKRPPRLPSSPRSSASRPNSLLDVQALQDRRR